MKKLLSILLAVLMVATLGVVNVVADENDESTQIAPQNEEDVNPTDSEWLQSKVDEGGEIVLQNDLDLDKTVVVTKDVVLNLNSHSISNSDEIWKEDEGAWSLFSVREGGKLTINGSGKLKAKENDCYVIDIKEGAEAILNGGEYIGNIHAVYVFKGNLIVNDGTFSVQQKYSASQPDQFVLNCRDENYKNGVATISVYGGKFLGFNPANCEAEGVGTNFLAGKNDVVENNGTFTVVKACAKIGDNYYATLQKAVDAANTMNLSNTESDEPITIDLIDKDGTGSLSGSGVIVKSGSNIIINFNNLTYYISEDPLAGSTGTESQCFQLLRDSKVIMKDGEIIADNPGVAMVIQNYSDLTLDNMILDSSKGNNNIEYVISNNCGNTVITGDTQLIAKAEKAAFDVYYWPNGGYAEGVTVTIDDKFTGFISGTIEYGSDNNQNNTEEIVRDKAHLVISGDGLINSSFFTYGAAKDNANIVIYDGTFTTDPSKYVKEGFYSYKSTSTTWRVLPNPIKAEVTSVNNSVELGNEIGLTYFVLENFKFTWPESVKEPGGVTYSITAGDSLVISNGYPAFNGTKTGKSTVTATCGDKSVSADIVVYQINTDEKTEESAGSANVDETKNNLQLETSGIISDILYNNTESLDNKLVLTNNSSVSSIKAAIENGDTIKTVLDSTKTDNLAEEAANSVVAAAESQLGGGAKIAGSFDIKVNLVVNDNVVANIKELDNAINLTIELPEEITTVPSGYSREVAIVRLHDGVATVIAKGNVSDLGSTITCSSNLFSEYVLVYRDTLDYVYTKPAAKKPVVNTSVR